MISVQNRTFVLRLSMLSLALLLLVLQETSPGAPSTAEGAGAESGVSFQTEVRPVLERYCYSCHGDEKQKADLNLQSFNDLESVRDQRDLWNEVGRKLRQSEMPPEGKPQPSDEERGRITAWIERELFPVDCNNPDPGRVTIRRLNRAEYNNTIRDLVGVSFRPADDFPNDDTGYGFDNIGDALSVSPLLMEKYLAAAEQILEAAIVTPESLTVPTKVFSAAALRGGDGQAPGDPLVLASEGEARVRLEVAAEGRYQVRIRAHGEQAGPEQVRMALRVEGKEVQEFQVQAKEDSPGVYEWTMRMEPGSYRLAVAFLNDYYNEADPNPENRDRNLVLHGVEVAGPLDRAPIFPETHTRIFMANPAPATTNEVARQILSRFATRAFRRPLQAGELERLERLCREVRAAGASFEEGIKVALQAVLVSPHFLFRGELQQDPNNPAVRQPIDEYALASRLSYFVWSSMPDEQLFGLAAQGKLRANLNAQVERMLKDSKARALVENFAGQWLQTRMLNDVAPDPQLFPGFDEELRQSMGRETELFFEHVLKEDRSIFDFFTADYTFVNERLAKHYQLENVRGPEFRRVSLSGTPRGGVLTHASVLTLTANPTRTSPVKRGKWVLENFLAQAPPPPPADVPPLNETSDESATASLRERMERHRADPACASCHTLMDPIGFSLENFNAVGAWRDQDGTFPIHASGKLSDSERFNGAAELRAILATQRRAQFARCLSEKLLTYALGRGLEYYDKCALDQILAQLEAGDFKMSALILAVVNSAPFQMRRGEGEG